MNMRKDNMIKKLIGAIIGQELIIGEMKRSIADLHQQNENIMGKQIIELL